VEGGSVAGLKLRLPEGRWLAPSRRHPHLAQRTRLLRLGTKVSALWGLVPGEGRPLCARWRVGSRERGQRLTWAREVDSDMVFRHQEVD